MTGSSILIIDFGSQYTQLIARKVRELSVFSLIHPHTIDIDTIKEINPKGIIIDQDLRGDSLLIRLEEEFK